MLKKEKNENSVEVTNGDLSAADERKLSTELASTRNALEKERTRRRSKPLMVLLTTLLLVALASAATIAVYKTYFEKPAVSNQNTSSGQNSSTTSSRMTARQVVDLAAPKVVGEPFDNGASGTPAIKVAGYDFFTRLSNTSSSHTATHTRSVDSGKVDSTEAALRSVLVEKGFTAKQIEAPVDTVTITQYLHKDVACELYQTTGSNDEAKQLFQFGCGDMSEYEAWSKALKPFADIYTKASTTEYVPDTSLLLSAPPKIKSSKTTGYSTAEVAISSTHEGESNAGGFAGLFYQTPDKVWHYFLGAQNNVRCDSYNSEDLKKAYLGEKCYDASSNSDKEVVL